MRMLFEVSMIDPNKVMQDAEQADRIIQRQRAEIERLRITDAERHEVSRAIEELLSGISGYVNEYADEMRRRAAVLCGLLEKHKVGQR
jgi:hypothetical protein